MSSGQSLVVQFILFFVIGLFLFIFIGNVFRAQSLLFREDVATAGRKLFGSYLSALIVTAYDSCKECDNVVIRGKIQNTTGSYFHQVQLSSAGLRISSIPDGQTYQSSAHNLNAETWSGSAYSVKTIIFTLSKNQNNLVVSQ